MLTIVLFAFALIAIQAQTSCFSPPQVGDHQSLFEALPILTSCTGSTDFNLMDSARERSIRTLKAFWSDVLVREYPTTWFSNGGPVDRPTFFYNFTRIVGLEVVFYGGQRRTVGDLSSTLTSASITLSPGEKIDSMIAFAYYDKGDFTSNYAEFPSYISFTTSGGRTFTAGEYQANGATRRTDYPCPGCFLTGFYGRATSSVISSLGFHVAGKKRRVTGVRIARMTFPNLNTSQPLTPNKVFQAILCNDGENSQVMSYSYSKSEGTQHSVTSVVGSSTDWNLNVEVGVVYSYNFGVPEIASTEVEVEGKFAYQHREVVSKSKETTEESNTLQTVESQIAIEVAPRTRVVGQFQWFDYYSLHEYRAKVLYEFLPLKGVIVFDTSGTVSTVSTTAIDGGWQAQSLSATETCYG